MKNGEIIYGTLSASEITIDRDEIRRRLGMHTPGREKSGFTDCEDFELIRHPVFQKCLEGLEREIEYKYAYANFELSFPEKGVCEFSCGRIISGDLYKNLKDCSSAFFLAVTTGLKAERHLNSLKLRSSAEHFISDAVASAAAESLCDYVNNIIKKEVNDNQEFESCNLRPRYSPGYGDCSIENQRLVLGSLCADKLLGITLNQSCFMTPSKSITAIVGVKK